MTESEDTTELIRALGRDAQALDRLMPRIYGELHRIAHRELVRRDFGATLRTTGLLHETYARLADQRRLGVEDRAHFLALASKAMRHIVIDFARAKGAEKRGGGWKRVTLDDVGRPLDSSPVDVVSVHEALERLERFDERLCRVVECRFFGGMTVAETATALGVSPRTVDRAWQKAKAWLYREMHEA